MKKISHSIITICLFIISNFTFAQKVEISRFLPIADTLQSVLKNSAFVIGKIKLDSVIRSNSSINLYFSTPLSEYSFRDDNTEFIYTLVRSMLPIEFSGYDLKLISNGSAIEEMIPPLYSNRVSAKNPREIKSAIKKLDRKESLVTNKSKPYLITNGLQKRHLAIWQSHGYYFEQKLLRWEWQRARIFQTVEDLYTQSYVLPFLVPMLENAGASVLLPRERDVQLNEIIVDNDTPFCGYSEFNGDNSWMNSGIPGFSNPNSQYISGENPFTMGSSRLSSTIKKGSLSYAKWTPQILQSGEYAVYVSYQTLPYSTSQAKYVVKHSGGETVFNVNQKMGGGTWIYLGTFYFKEGQDSGQYVLLSNLTDKNGEIVSADGVKFGGGMGNIARKPSEFGYEPNRKSSSNEPITKVILDLNVDPQISNYPRFTEGARYWLQWAGFSDTIYSPNKDANDYNDDYMSRGRWVNVISGGSDRNPQERGLNIPVDMAFAFHTDAGTTLNDSIIGTLGIYTRFSNGSDIFPDGSPRFQSRYLTDLIQTQIVDDIKALYEPIWQRRGIWDRSYSESRSPKVPTMLLELLSHQNFADMRYGLDPDFRFHVSRSIYKGMLRFISQESGIPYIIQPLPVSGLISLFTNDSLTLRWSAVEDPLEPTAKPDRFVVYTRIDGGGFDNGVVVNTPLYQFIPEKGRVYSFKISALNGGGESFPSEIVSAYKAPFEKGKVLIINGFDRVSAPYSFASKDSSIAGFFDHTDGGVPYIRDISFIGRQYEYRRNIPWMDDDSPGFGSSFADYETKVIAGNTFDYPYIHGKVFAKAGYSFVSMSRDALINNKIDYSEYFITDIILGKQMKTKIGRGVKEGRFETFPAHLRDFIYEYTASGGNILISGANVATDLWDNIDTNRISKKFATEVLKYQWRTNNASKTGEVKGVQSPYNFTGLYTFHTQPNENVYCVESPDGIEPVGKDAWTIFRYADNNISAGVAYSGSYKSVVLGFPVETLKEESQIINLINSVILFFKEVR